MRPTLPIVLLALASCGGVSDGGAGGSGDGGRQPYFATAPRGNVVMQALFRGPLLDRDDCILIGDTDHASLPIWPEGFTVERDDAGRVVVRDDAGATVAREGATFEMGGGYVAEFEPRDEVDPREGQLLRVEEALGAPIPDRCLGSGVYGIWSVGEIEPITAEPGP